MLITGLVLVIVALLILYVRECFISGDIIDDLECDVRVAKWETENWKSKYRDKNGAFIEADKENNELREYTLAASRNSDSLERTIKQKQSRISTLESQIIAITDILNPEKDQT